MAKGPSSLGQRIAEAYQSAGMTRYEFAKRVGAHYPNVARWEKGETRPTKRSLRRVADAAGVSMRWLLGESSDMREGATPFHEWLEQKAPADLTEDEREVLESWGFGRLRPPPPEFYSVALSWLRLRRE